MGLTEKVTRGQDQIKKESMNTMADAMQAMNDPAVMAEAMKMMKDPQFAQQMKAMQNDPTMKKYMAAVSIFFSHFKIKSHE